MERLTKRVGANEAIPICDFDICAPFARSGKCKTGSQGFPFGRWERHCNDTCILGRMIDRLADYEDTGLTPEEINKLDTQRKAMAALAGGMQCGKGALKPIEVKKMACEQENQMIVGGYKPKYGEIRVPKTVAIVKMFGGAIRLSISDSVEYEIPTEEQRENLKRVFGIDIEVLEDGK